MVMVAIERCTNSNEPIRWTLGRQKTQSDSLRLDDLCDVGIRIDERRILAGELGDG